MGSEQNRFPQQERVCLTLIYIISKYLLFWIRSRSGTSYHIPFLSLLLFWFKLIHTQSSFSDLFITLTFTLLLISIFSNFPFLLDGRVTLLHLFFHLVSFGKILCVTYTDLRRMSLGITWYLLIQPVAIQLRIGSSFLYILKLFSNFHNRHFIFESASYASNLTMHSWQSVAWLKFFSL